MKWRPVMINMKPLKILPLTNMHRYHAAIARVMLGGVVAFGMAACGSTAPDTAAHDGASPRPQRIVSLNLCADQLLVSLADRTQIAGLTRNAADPEMSAVAGEVAGLRILGNAAEEVLEINPDLVIGMPTRRSAALGALKGRDYPSLDLKTARSVDDIYKGIAATAKAVGHMDRGAILVDGMKSALSDVPNVGRGRVAAYYQRRGFMTGTGTLVDDLMRRAGLVNLAAQIGKPSLAQISLEEMVHAQPDFIIMESSTATISDQGSEMLHHPALRGIPRLYLREAWTVCGGPAYVQAAQSLAQQIVRHDAGRAGG